MALKVGFGIREEDLDIQGEIDFDFFDNEQKRNKTPVDENLSEYGNNQCVRKKTLIETVIPSLSEFDCHSNKDANSVEMEDDTDKSHSPTNSISMTDSEGSSPSEESIGDLSESDSITDVTPLTSPCSDSPLPGFFQNENISRRQIESSGNSDNETFSDDFGLKRKENVKFADEIQCSSNTDDSAVDLNSLLNAIHRLEVEQNKNTDEKKHYQTCLCSKRKNMSFSNEEVRHIDQENQRLLKKILSQQNRPLSKHFVPKSHISQSRVSSSTVNRLRQQRQIELENLALLKRIESAKPSRDLSRNHLLRDYERLSSFSCSSRASSRPQSANRKPYHPGYSSIQQSLRSNSLTSLQSSGKATSVPSQIKSKCIRPNSTSSTRTYVIQQHQTSDSKS